MSAGVPYPGGELELFAQATNWKRYVADQVRDLLVGSVLEVGAGLGASTAIFRTAGARRWVCLEPDVALARQLEPRARALGCEVAADTLGGYPAVDRFDAILYLDVLEHIADDRAEVALAAGRLAPEGRLIVLSPAHPSLFSAFDAAVGHHRRYTRRTLLALTPASLRVETCRYLDSVGVLVSLANRLLLRQDCPSLQQVLVWDRWIVPLSRRLDPLLRWRLGKSVLAVWTPAAAHQKSSLR